MRPAAVSRDGVPGRSVQACICEVRREAEKEKIKLLTLGASKQAGQFSGITGK